MNFRMSNVPIPQGHHQPIVRALDVGYGRTKLVTGIAGPKVSDIRCASFPSRAYPTRPSHWGPMDGAPGPFPLGACSMRSGPT